MNVEERISHIEELQQMLDKMAARNGEALAYSWPQQRAVLVLMATACAEAAGVIEIAAMMVKMPADAVGLGPMLRARSYIAKTAAEAALRLLDRLKENAHGNASQAPSLAPVAGAVAEDAAARSP